MENNKNGTEQNAEEIKTLNIYQRMARVTAEMPQISPMPVEVEGNQKPFNAIREKQVLDAIRPLEEKYGIYSYPISRELKTSTSLNGYFVDCVKVTYRFVNVDKPEEYIDMIAYGRGIDSFDKSPGKAMTYSDKYALMKAYKISGNDSIDPDSASPDATVQFVSETPVQTNSQSFQDSTNGADNQLKYNPVFQHISKASTVNNTESEQLTLEEAKNFKLTIGEDSLKGKTLGEVLVINRSLIDWFANSTKFDVSHNEYNRQLRDACLKILES